MLKVLINKEETKKQGNFNTETFGQIWAFTLLCRQLSGNKTHNPYPASQTCVAEVQKIQSSLTDVHVESETARVLKRFDLPLNSTMSEHNRCYKLSR